MKIESSLDARSTQPGCATNVAATGLNPTNLMKLVLKTFYVRGIETPKELSNSTGLHIAIAKELLDTAKDKGLAQVLGSFDEDGYTSFRYGLTGMGREWAVDALAQCQYIGPAPVTLDDYRSQVLRQSVKNEHVQRDLLVDRLSHLVVPEALERNLGPAVNSGRSLLLYGPPGNGKTSIAEAIAKTFHGNIHIPYCLEVEGEIIKIFDPIVHFEASPEVEDADRTSDATPCRPEYTDRRWLRCRRPVVMVGGELTLSMLDLYYSPVAKFYEAPLQMKANGGTFIVDDVGRQLINPKDLLNRWIIPMEKRIDYMVLQTGGNFSIPFDNLLIFSTNLDPADLMDPAFLRRIPYKVEVLYPNEAEFRTVFETVCRENDLELSDDAVAYAMHEIRSIHSQPLAFYQPKFIVDQIIATSKYEDRKPELSKDLLAAAIANISAQSTETGLPDSTPRA